VMVFFFKIGSCRLFAGAGFELRSSGVSHQWQLCLVLNSCLRLSSEWRRQ
jgi:hypothetical protein